MEIRDANHFTMSGGGLQITVLPDGPGALQIGYLGAEPAHTFDRAELVDETGSVGSSVSVVLSCMDGDDRMTLTLLVPRVRVRPGQWAPMHTIGITTVHADRDDPDVVDGHPGRLGQLGHSTVLELTGTASFVDAER